MSGRKSTSRIASYGIHYSTWVSSVAMPPHADDSSLFALLGQRRIARHAPVLVRSMVDPDLRERRHQHPHHRRTVLVRCPVQAAAQCGGAVDQLAPKHVDSFDRLLQDDVPFLLGVPALRLVSSAASGLPDLLTARFLPEVLTRIVVPKDLDAARIRLWGFGFLYLGLRLRGCDHFHPEGYSPDSSIRCSRSCRSVFLKSR